MNVNAICNIISKHQAIQFLHDSMLLVLRKNIWISAIIGCKVLRKKMAGASEITCLPERYLQHPSERPYAYAVHPRSHRIRTHSMSFFSFQTTATASLSRLDRYYCSLYTIHLIPPIILTASPRICRLPLTIPQVLAAKQRRSFESSLHLRLGSAGLVL